MTTERLSVVVRVRYRWWFWPYLWALVFFCRLHDAQPRPETVDWLVRRGTVLTIARK